MNVIPNELFEFCFAKDVEARTDAGEFVMAAFSHFQGKRLHLPFIHHHRPTPRA